MRLDIPLLPSRLKVAESIDSVIRQTRESYNSGFANDPGSRSPAEFVRVQTKDLKYSSPKVVLGETKSTVLTDTGRYNKDHVSKSERQNVEAERKEEDDVFMEFTGLPDVLNGFSEVIQVLPDVAGPDEDVPVHLPIVIPPAADPGAGLSSTVDVPLSRRSRRVPRPPQRLKDYVLK